MYAALEQRRTDQLVIVTTASLGGETIEHYGLEHFNGWGLGRRNVNNGVFLVVAPDERRARIEIGCGLGNSLPDASAPRSCSDILPQFARATSKPASSPAPAPSSRASTSRRPRRPRRRAPREAP